MRHREVHSLAQSHTGKKGQRDVDPGSLAPTSMLPVSLGM